MISTALPGLFSDLLMSYSTASAEVSRFYLKKKKEKKKKGISTQG